MTEQQAVLNTYGLWVWLFNNPGKDKTDWPKKEETKLIDRVHLCFMCEIYFNVSMCKGCPLNKKYVCGWLGDSIKASFEWEKILFFGETPNSDHTAKQCAALVASNIRRYAIKKGYMK